jgi:hypothetical protein
MPVFAGIGVGADADSVACGTGVDEAGGRREGIMAGIRVSDACGMF